MGEKIIICKKDSSVRQEIEVNNAEEVLKSFQTPSGKGLISYLTMVQGNSYSEVTITDTNIKSNSDFIADIWD